jgi:hypothetical protein
MTEESPRASGADDAEPRPSGPVGTGDYTVQPGDCLASIAFLHGRSWEDLWNLPENQELKRVRQDPHVLLPGDRVTIPPLRLKKELGGTEQRHTFSLKRMTEMLDVRVLRDDVPRAREPYTLTVDGQVSSGTTDGDGHARCAIAPNARRAVLRVGTEPDADEYQLALGELDPITELSGIQGRLNSLGLDCGPVDGQWGPRTETALLKYQRKRGLRETGKPDSATREKLREEYGC